MKQGNISLRAPEPEDLEVMLSFENDAALWELGTATGPYSRYQMKRYIAESQNDLYADGNCADNCVRETGSSRYCGCVFL